MSESPFPHAENEPQRDFLRDLLIAIVPLLIIAVSVGAYKRWGYRNPPPAAPPKTEKAEQVSTAKVAPFEKTIDISVEGVVRPYRYVTLSAEVAGRVLQKAPECQEGTYVSKGALLFEIDSKDYELAVRRITKELEQAVNALKEWEVERSNTVQRIELGKDDVKLAAREVERLRDLATQRISTASDIDRAERQRVTAENALLLSENELRMLDARYDRAVSTKELKEVELERAKRDLERTKVYALAGGTIVTENVEQDGYVQPGTPMVVINDTTEAEVICRIELDDMYWIWGGQSASAALAALTGVSNEIKNESAAIGASPIDAASTSYAFPKTPCTVEFRLQDMVCEWPGELVRYVGSGVDQTTRTVPCLVSVKDPRSGKLSRVDGTPITGLTPPPLTVGMYVTVRNHVKSFAPLFSVPSEALRTGGTVWAVGDGKLQIKPVKLARRLSGNALLFSDSTELKLGDEVVTSPLAFVREGMLVQPEASVR